MDSYQMFFPGSSSSAAAAAPSQLQALVYSKRGTTANLGGERSTSAIGHGLLGSTLQLTGTENHVTTSNGRHLVGNHSSEAGAANHSDEAADDSSAGKMINKINSKKKLKKPKYAFQTRSQVDILDDGYRWRKYGQKAVKANKFPRSYYRCTYEGCNVKKQVQRLSKDEGVVVTTYEGMHTHPIDKPNSDNFEHILTQMQLTNYTTTPSQPS